MLDGEKNVKLREAWDLGRRLAEIKSPLLEIALHSAGDRFRARVIAMMLRTWPVAIGCTEEQKRTLAAAAQLKLHIVAIVENTNDQSLVMALMGLKE